MVTSARALTESEWQVLLDLRAGLPGWLRPDPETLDRLVAMGLAALKAGGDRLELTWTGREFVELRLSGIYQLVAGTPASAAP